MGNDDVRNTTRADGHADLRATADRLESILQGSAIDGGQTETERIRHSRFMAVLLSISGSFINVAPDAVDEAFNDAIRAIGSFEHADRCYVFEINHGVESTMSNTHEWCADGIEPEIENLQDVPTSVVPWWMERLLANEAINIQDVSKLPPEADSERQILAAQSIRSVLVVPIRIGDRLLGFLGFDSVRAAHPWSDDSITLVRMVADVFANAMERRNAERSRRADERNYREFLESMSDIALVGDTHGRIIFANSATRSKLGYSNDELLTMHILDIHPAAVRAEATVILGELLSGERDVCPLPLEHKNGSLLPVETRAWTGTWGGAECLFGICKDLSVEQEALQKFDRLFHSNPSPMALSRIEDGVFVDVNDAFLQYLGYEKSEVLHRTSGDLSLFIDQDRQSHVARELAENGRIRDVELRVRTKHGGLIEGLFSGEVVESQGAQYFLTVMVDITERKQVEEVLRTANLELQELSLRDPLTGLYNRQHLLGVLELELTRLARTGDPVSVAMIDVDHFKALNDTYGHAAGDAALTELGAHLRSYARGGDLVCRYGGEEFIWVLPATPLDVACERAEDLIGSVRELPISVGGTAIGFTISVGVACSDDPAVAAESLIASADEALYRAKRTGRDRMCI